MTTLVVDAVGAQALVVDRGRPGWAHIGVTGAGALDRPALALANRLVGNPEHAAGLEVLLGGLEVRTEDATTVAVTGPPGPLVVRRAGRAVRSIASHAPVHLRAGDVLAVGAPTTGLRRYLAVAGGVALSEVLGSRSADTLSGLGPAPLAAGDRLPVGTPTGDPVAPGPVGVTAVPAHLEVPVLLGPRDDWVADARARVAGTTWTVGPDADRVGVRLRGPALERSAQRRGTELRSEPLVAGAVQVPPDGQPVVFLADHPTTGGYPVVCVVEAASLASFAQAVPGSTVRLVPRP